MPNIVLTRIDNRLVHGQVATQWCGPIGANLILVANDEVAGNKLRQGLMDMAAPSYAAMRYWTIEKTISTIHKASDKQHIFIVCETPQDVLKLVEGGVPIKKLILVICIWQTENVRLQVLLQSMMTTLLLLQNYVTLV